MAITINASIASMHARRSLDKNTSALNVSLSRLASGLRINSAADDAAGLALSTRMTAEILSANAAIKNANDGISLMQVADSALVETTTALQRIRELAVQANTSTISGTDQNNLQLEVTELMQEIQRISTTTDFNDVNLLDGTYSTGANVYQIGTEGSQTIAVSIAGASVAKIGASTGIGNDGISVGSGAYALGYIASTIVNVDVAIDSVSAIRAQIGAYQSRLESVVNSLSSMAEVTEVARSRITDADIAQETANMAKLTILQQAGIAVIAQANQQPSIAYKLLSGVGN
ncbi:MAG: flagellin FliC [Magnetococcales bacterium]|nr:flagellin FliC [Magnetococcales bacterium]